MSSTSPDVSPSVVASGYVAEVLPPTAEPPQPARRIGFLKALLLFWILPRRYGPHLVVGSARRAFAAHLLSLLSVALVWLVPDVRASLLEPRVWLHEIRIALAETVISQAEASAWSAGPSWVMPVIVIGSVPVLQLAILLLATLTMPWCAGGDSTASVWKRSLKNVYWTTTILIPGALVARGIKETGPGSIETDWIAVLLGIIIIGVPPVLVLRALLLGAGRLVGPAVGPAFAPREPRCEACGYALVGLRADSRCPECGLVISKSLPGGRRRPTPWQQHELTRRGFSELLRMQWRILRDPGVLRRIPVHSGLPAARHFWWGTFLLIGVITLAVLNGLYYYRPRASLWDVGCAPAAFIALPLVFVLQALVMFFFGLWAQFRHGITDYRVSAIVCYYAAPLMWPLIGVLALGAGLLSEASRAWLDTRLLWLSNAGVGVTKEHLVIGLIGLFGLLCLRFWLLRLVEALAAARYANV